MRRILFAATVATVALLGDWTAPAQSDANSLILSRVASVVPVSMDLHWRAWDAYDQASDRWDRHHWYQQTSPEGVTPWFDVALQVLGQDFRVRLEGSLAPGSVFDASWVAGRLVYVAHHPAGEEAIIQRTPDCEMLSAAQFGPLIDVTLFDHPFGLVELAARSLLTTTGIDPSGCVAFNCAAPTELYPVLDGRLDPARGGLPVWWRFSYPDLNREFYQEYRVLASESMGGRDYPTHALMMSVADGHAHIAEFTVQCWDVDPGITQATLAVEVPRVNSVVLDRLEGYMARYDRDGNEVSRQEIAPHSGMAVGAAIHKQFAAQRLFNSRRSALAAIVTSAAVATCAAGVIARRYRAQ